jgi:hypothetical protein
MKTAHLLVASVLLLSLFVALHEAVNADKLKQRTAAVKEDLQFKRDAINNRLKEAEAAGDVELQQALRLKLEALEMQGLSSLGNLKADKDTLNKRMDEKINGVPELKDLRRKRNKEDL